MSNHTRVDHIIIQGSTQEEIGYELGRIGIEKFNAVLVPYEDPIYGKAKEEYFHLHDPVLYVRIKGIKHAYYLKEDDLSLDPSTLLYTIIFPSCSAIYFPPSGHAMGGKDLEWFFNPKKDDFDYISASNYESLLANRVRGWIHVIEPYPMTDMQHWYWAV